MSEPTEAELVRRVSEGDQVAYHQLLDDQLPSVSRYVARMLGNASEAEDITQEVFLRLWTHADRFNPKASRLSTWLHNIAHNLCIDHFRKHRRIVDGEPDPNIAGGDEPDTQVMASMDADYISEAMIQLPERQRSAIVMCHYQGLSNKEAADILDVSVDALESLLARGRRNLKTLLSQQTNSRAEP